MADLDRVIDDNPGSGFAADDDDEDFQHMLEMASQGASDDGEGDLPPGFLQDEKNDDKNDDPWGAPKQERSYSPASDLNYGTPPVVEKPEPKVEPQPVPEPALEPAPEPFSQQRTLSNAGQTNAAGVENTIEDIEKIIKVLDAYREVPTEDQIIVAQFIHYSQDADPKDEATLVYKAIHAKNSLSTSMIQLSQAVQQTDRIERIFSILRLTEKELHDIGVLVTSFTGDKLDKNLDKITYAKILEASIEKIEDSSIKYIEETKGVLAIAKE